jgi:hypothetical protein
LLGENFILKELKKVLPEEKLSSIIHISIKDDTKGYDIEFDNIINEKKLLEVKTSSLPGNTFSFYLSRNEYEVGKLNTDNWSVVLVKLSNGTPVFFGALTVDDLNKYLPEEKFEDKAKWQVIKFLFESETVKYRDAFVKFIHG